MAPLSGISGSSALPRPLVYSQAFDHVAEAVASIVESLGAYSVQLTRATSSSHVCLPAGRLHLEALLHVDDATAFAQAAGALPRSCSPRGTS